MMSKDKCPGSEPVIIYYSDKSTHWCCEIHWTEQKERLRNEIYKNGHCNHVSHFVYHNLANKLCTDNDNLRNILVELANKQ